jgi:hypothetical protein
MMKRQERSPLIARPTDPPARERGMRGLMRLEVSKEFAAKIARIAQSTKIRSEEIFERALDLAIADYHAAQAMNTTVMVHKRTYPALPPHHHTIIHNGHEAIYYFGRIGVAVNHRCNLIAVGIAPANGDD